MPARNEEWVIGASLRIALLWVDEVVVLDHASTDRTAAIVEAVGAEHPGRVTLLQEADGGWPEMEHRQRLLEAARARGATHIAIVDADEILTANHLPRIRELIEALPPRGALAVGMPCLWRSLDAYRADAGSVWANRWDLTLAFHDSRELYWQASSGYQHHHREPHGIQSVRRHYVLGGAMHLQFAPWRRLTAKHAYYKVHERLTYPDRAVARIDAMYSLALDERGLRTLAVPEGWWSGYEAYRAAIDLEAVPWHEAAVRRELLVHGAAHFAGLNLFGLEDVYALG